MTEESFHFPTLSSKSDLLNLISYFEATKKSIEELADKEQAHWYELGDTFYRGFYDALDDCLKYLYEQKQVREELELQLNKLSKEIMKEFGNIWDIDRYPLFLIILNNAEKSAIRCFKNIQNTEEA